MDKALLCTALSNVCEEELLSSMQQGIYEEHKFSKAFEEKMQSIIHPKEPINIRKRLRLALVLAAVLAAGFLLGMTAGRTWGFKMQEKEDGIYASFDVDTVKDAKRKVNELYELTYIPEGYELRDKYINPFGQSVSYMYDNNAENDDEWKVITYSVFTPYYYRNIFLGNEGKRSTAFEDGIQYYISEPSEDYTAVIWYQDGYVMVISGTIAKNEALDLCKSVELVEK